MQTHDGRPYDHDAYPHLGAPGGPCDAFDDSQVRDIWLQFGSRLGKTFFGNACLMFAAANRPCPMMFASAAEKLAVEVVSRVYAMLDRCNVLRPQLRPENRRTQDRIDLSSCRIWVGWSRSVATLADKAVKVGHANEIDKWEHVSTSKEADPLKLFEDRFKEYPRHKKIKESTPSVKGRSRIERGVLQSTNCRYYVPCPHCGEYQTLRMGDGNSPGGLAWDKNDIGKSDRDIARRTARYVCAHCEKNILDHHRTQMMRRGVWCPEGCGVDSEAARKAADNPPKWAGWRNASWLTGRPVRDGLDAGYQLSSLYATALSWGDIAAEFVNCKAPQDLRNFINQWLGETWEVVHRQQTWEQLGERIIDNDQKPGIVPKWASMLTVAIDRQQDNGDDRFPWVIDAWGPGQRVATVAYGQAFTFDELHSIVGKKWEHADGRDPLGIRFGLFDTGFLPRDIDTFCLKCNAIGLQIYQCKGSSTAMKSDWEYTVLGKNTARPGMAQYMVDTIRSQLWIEGQLAATSKDDADGYSIYRGSLAEHQDFLEQLLNDAPVEKLDATNNIRQAWERISTSIPNDYRACRRYSRAAMLIATRNGPILPRGFKPITGGQQAPPSRVRELRIRR